MNKNEAYELNRKQGRSLGLRHHRNKCYDIHAVARKAARRYGWSAAAYLEGYMAVAIEKGYGLRFDEINAANNAVAAAAAAARGVEPDGLAGGGSNRRRRER